MKYKMAANQALKRFSRQIIKEDAIKDLFLLGASVWTAGEAGYHS
jgi:hypothetical protein